jgi:hypothetical protein
MSTYRTKHLLQRKLSGHRALCFHQAAKFFTPQRPVLSCEGIPNSFASFLSLRQRSHRLPVFSSFGGGEPITALTAAADAGLFFCSSVSLLVGSLAKGCPVLLSFWDVRVVRCWSLASSWLVALMASNLGCGVVLDVLCGKQCFDQGLDNRLWL